MDNFKVKAYIMKSGVPYSGIVYNKISWDEEAIKNRKIFVAINYYFTKDNIVGVVTSLSMEKDLVVAEIILNTSEDSDIMLRLKRSVFLAGIETISQINMDNISSDTVKENFKSSSEQVAKIISVGMVNSKMKAFVTEGSPMWVGMGKTDEKIVIPEIKRREAASEEEEIVEGTTSDNQAGKTDRSGRSATM